MIRDVTYRDAQSIANIYNFYIENTVTTFEEVALQSKDFISRINKSNVDSLPWLVAELDGEVIGYAYATKWKERTAYRFSVEITVYLKPALKAKGWGTRLYTNLLKKLKSNPKKIHAVIAGISLPNAASIALHEKIGMQQVAEFKEIGFKLNRWVDTGYWQMIL